MLRTIAICTDLGKRGKFTYFDLALSELVKTHKEQINRTQPGPLMDHIATK
jgi:hypothetical protein